MNVYAEFTGVVGFAYLLFLILDMLFRRRRRSFQARLLMSFIIAGILMYHSYVDLGIMALAGLCVAGVALYGVLGTIGGLFQSTSHKGRQLN